MDRLYRDNLALRFSLDDWMVDVSLGEGFSSTFDVPGGWFRPSWIPSTALPFRTGPFPEHLDQSRR